VASGFRSDAAQTDPLAPADRSQPHPPADDSARPARASAARRAPAWPTTPWAMTSPAVAILRCAWMQASRPTCPRRLLGTRSERRATSCSHTRFLRNAVANGAPTPSSFGSKSGSIRTRDPSRVLIGPTSPRNCATPAPSADPFEPAGLQVFPPPFERSQHLSENRGIPGSSPGLAIDDELSARGRRFWFAPALASSPRNGPRMGPWPISFASWRVELGSGWSIRGWPTLTAARVVPGSN
jgi:hypothetical protein